MLSFEHEREAQALSEKINKSLGKDHGGHDESLIGTFDDNVDEGSDWLEWETPSLLLTPS
jgi:hypothetical protein